MVEWTVDVTDAARLGEPAAVAVSVVLPTASTDPPVICVARAGGGFSRGYYTEPLPGGSSSQAVWHAARGWTFVAIDHLGTGASSHHDPERLTFAVVADANDAAEEAALQRLGLGDDAVRLGLGHSMGAALTIVQQARHHRHDGIGVLGYGVTRSTTPVPPGEPPVRSAIVSRDDGRVLNRGGFDGFVVDRPAATAWSHHHDDVDRAALVAPERWTSPTSPGLLRQVLTPGIVAPEAAAIDVPVLVAMGERDVVVDPSAEPRAFVGSSSVDLFVCPRMGHLHNFASTRDLLWRRIESWGAWVAAQR